MPHNHDDNPAAGIILGLVLAGAFWLAVALLWAAYTGRIL